MFKSDMKQEAAFKQAKDSIRKEILKFLRNQKEEDRLTKSLRILKKLFALSEFKRATTVLFYASFDGEVETFEMMKQAQRLGKRIALPIIETQGRHIFPTIVNNLEKDLAFGPHGIKQPAYDKKLVLDLGEIDVSIVPGVAFDADNYRLGRGAGYYDRFLARLSQKTSCLGLAFDFQIVPSLPHQQHDVPVSRVIVN